MIRNGCALQGLILTHTLRERHGAAMSPLYEEIGMQRLDAHIKKIGLLDQTAMSLASIHHTRLAKPPGSMGKLEDIAVQLAGITGKVKNQVERRRIIVLCADNGVTEEGVSLASKCVTVAQAINMTKGGTGMSALAQYFGAEVQVVDVGIASEYECPAILNRRVMCGTNNFTCRPAMPHESAVKAILTGIELAKQAKDDNIDIIGVGEMGVGNSTSASAVLAALTGMPVELVLGSDGEMSDAAFSRKKKAIKTALKQYCLNPNYPIDILSKVGGLDLAAMCGVYLGAAEYRCPVVIDGFVSAVAALCAARLCPTAAKYMFSSHAATDHGYHLVAQQLDLSPCLNLNMSLGEGSGCPLAFEVIAAACAIMREMATFEEASIDDSYLDEIEESGTFLL